MPSAAPSETEAKFRLRDRAAFEARLDALGAAPRPTVLETNLLFDDSAGSRKERGEALRLRIVEGRGLLTFKGKASFAGGIKTRLELETGVESPERIRQILGALGLSPSFLYEKRRTPWRFADPARPLVEIDETPLGLFAELEGEDAAVRALAAQLGISEGEFLADSYVSLWAKARAHDPTLSPDMLFGPGSRER